MFFFFFFFFFFCGGIEGQNEFLRGQKSKNLLKLPDFDHFSSDEGANGASVEGRASDGWGANAPCPP